MRYDERIVDQVQSANDIVEIIGQYVPLKRSGRNLKGLCPFHQEKTPSFMVNAEKQIFHCFGCAAGGDVFSFLMRYENMSFPEAIRRLAERAHIQLPEKSLGQEEGTSDNEKYYEIYRLACDFYRKQFLEPQMGKLARDYFFQRKFDDALSEEMKMGWAGDSWDGLLQFLRKKGFEDQLILKSGLICRSSKGTLFDLFRSRLLFPIHNLQGKVVAFGGRIIGDREGPKYLNSPENPIFHKRRELFGLHLAKKFIDRDKPQIYVVEGYFGFLRLYQNGFKSAVATLGTALTDDHVRVLKRFAEEAIVIYDGDRAGEAASIRGLEVFLEGDMNVKLAKLSGGLDPDDFIREKGPEAFRQLIDGAFDFFDFKMEILQKRFNRKDALGVMKISSDFLETFAKIKNPILLTHYMRKLSDAISIDEAALRAHLAKLTDRGSALNRPAEPAQPETPKSASKKGMDDEIICFALAVENPRLRPCITAELTEPELADPGIRQLLQLFLSLSADSRQLTTAKILARIEDETFKARLVSVYAFEWNEQDKEKAFRDCLRNIRKKCFEKKLLELRQSITQAERSHDQVRLAEFVREYQTLMKVKI
jgi:DNA primase